MIRILGAAGVAVGLLSGGGAMGAERTVVLAVDNMTCESCPFIVKKSLQKVSGVSNVVVSFKDKTATVTFDDTITKVPALVAATTNAGYPSHPTEPAAK